MKCLPVVILLSIFQIINLKAMSQILGEYVFSRQEMVAVFNFSSDNRFKFFLSYGAVDRIATGTFSVEGDILKLKSSKQPGKDFSVAEQSKSGTGYTIRFRDDNRYLLSNICCTFFIGSNRYEEFTDHNGEIKVDFAHCDKIYVQHMLYPDIVTLIKDVQNDNNKFICTINPSLVQVSFKSIDLEIEDENTITCMPNYLMMFEDIQFKKK